MAIRAPRNWWWAQVDHDDRGPARMCSAALDFDLARVFVGIGWFFDAQA
jgi:hypothetical protein